MLKDSSAKSKGGCSYRSKSDNEIKTADPGALRVGIRKDFTQLNHTSKFISNLEQLFSNFSMQGNNLEGL